MSFKLIIAAMILGFGLFMCTITTPWLFDPRPGSPLQLFGLLFGWAMVVWGTVVIVKLVIGRIK